MDKGLDIFASSVENNLTSYGVNGRKFFHRLEKTMEGTIQYSRSGKPSEKMIVKYVTKRKDPYVPVLRFFMPKVRTEFDKILGDEKFRSFILNIYASMCPQFQVMIIINKSPKGYFDICTPE